MKYNLLCFQTSGRLIIFFNKHDYQVSTSLMKQNKRYKGLKTAKWISIWDLVPGLFLTVRSAGWQLANCQNTTHRCSFFQKKDRFITHFCSKFGRKWQVL